MEGIDRGLKDFFFHSLYCPLGPWPLIFSFMIVLQTVGLLERVISSSKCLYLNIGQHRHRINTYTYQISMHYVGFEFTIPVSERAKTGYVLGLSATMTGRAKGNVPKFTKKGAEENHGKSESG
jgi:hypothetical protein